MATKDDITLVQTSWMCPEQYDAYIGDTKVGYLRLRHGHFTVEVPDVFGHRVYEASLTDWQDQGAFADDEQRAKYLRVARKAIARYLRDNE